MFDISRSCCALFLGALCACGPVGDAGSQVGTRTDAIQGGVESIGVQPIVGVSVLGQSICSGTLIAPNLVLTAQHCIARTPEQFVVCGESEFIGRVPAAWMWVTVEDHYDATETWYEGAEYFFPPGGSDLCGYDMALIVLSEPVPAEVAEYVIPRVDEPVVAGEFYTAMGYGHTGDSTGFGIRRELADREVVCVGFDCARSSQVLGTEFAGSDGTCQGDSGGPAIDERGRVIGVLSRGEAGSCRQPTYGAVPSWGEWMREVGAAAAEAGGYDAPPWVTDGSSDPALVDFDGDGVRDGSDNCPDVANPEQLDGDGDGIGDACPPPVEQRGGECSICDGCLTDADCGPEGTCLIDGASGVCALPCVDGACSDWTDAACVDGADLPGGVPGSWCVDAGFAAGAGALCFQDWVCARAPAVEQPVEQGDDAPADDEGPAAGCAAAPSPGTFPWWVGLLGAFMMRRRPRIR